MHATDEASERAIYIETFVYILEGVEDVCFISQFYYISPTAFYAKKSSYNWWSVSKLDIQWFKDWSYQFRDRLSTQLQAVAYAIYMPFHEQLSKILGLDLN